MLIFSFTPAASIGSMPRRTVARSPPRAIFENASGFSVSRLTLRRLMPESRISRDLRLEQLAIRRDRNVAQRLPHHGRQELIELGRHQRFAAGDAQLLDTGRRHQQLDRADHLRRRQLVFGRDQSFAVRNAVFAGVVARRGETHPQIAKASALCVNDHGRRSAWVTISAARRRAAK